ncbi:MAG: hypothetical protein GPOALKHO_000311 [Sodalis sp.]|nr:MAG: hypothetical protein GPOALKHO_000311 [Sodalis sp.]
MTAKAAADHRCQKRCHDHDERQRAISMNNSSSMTTIPICFTFGIHSPYSFFSLILCVNDSIRRQAYTSDLFWLSARSTPGRRCASSTMAPIRSRCSAIAQLSSAVNMRLVVIASPLKVRRTHCSESASKRTGRVGSFRGDVVQCNHRSSSVSNTRPVVSMSSRPATCGLSGTGSLMKYKRVG